MSEPTKKPLVPSDPQVFFDNLSQALETGAEIFREMAEAKTSNDSMASLEDMQKSFLDIATAYTHHPEKLVEKQMQFWQTQNELWTNAWQQYLGQGEQQTTP
ncbi:hypothetical protein MNBD_ALPHA08-2145, partial [hydrothermal vent metagenome]